MNNTNKKYDPTIDGAVVAIKISDTLPVKATLAFAFGGTVEIEWDRVDQRETYSAGINAYTVIYDERCAKYNRTFESFVREKKN